MPDILYPADSGELTAMLRHAAELQHSVEIFGAGSKRLMAGSVTPAAIRISTLGMKRILKYEPRDLTISVESGLPYTDLCRELARNGQMLPFSGPYSASATIGGVVAANISESRRRGYGTARDLVIGMEFATLEGKLIRSGGMVVKNVAGLDMGKLMIGSFGTLAAIATLNFKLLPVPTASRTLICQFEDLKAAQAALQSVMQRGLNPIAADILNPILVALFSARLNMKSFVLALQFAGNDAAIGRCSREASASCRESGGDAGTIRELTHEEDQRFWSAVAQITPRHLDKFQEGAVVRISTPLAQCNDALATVEGPGHAMAASGVVRAWFSRSDAASRWLNATVKRGWNGVIEFAAEGVDRAELDLWPAPGGDFEIMKGIGKMFNPAGLLNRGRLYNLL